MTDYPNTASGAVRHQQQQHSRPQLDIQQPKARNQPQGQVTYLIRVGGYVNIYKQKDGDKNGYVHKGIDGDDDEDDKKANVYINTL